MKKYISKVRTWILQHRLVCIIAACVLSAVIILIIVFSGKPQAPVILGPGSVLKNTFWSTNEQGYPFYEQDGFSNVYGIDISEWVGEIDFKKIKSSGFDFVVLRVGYRGYETGKFVLDNSLAEYLKAASSAGLRIGAYFVSQAISEEEAAEEAEFVIEHVKGYNIDMPIYIDLEDVYDVARTDHLTREDYTKIVQAFLDTLTSQGYHGGIYANEAWYQEKLDLARLKDYDLWLAKYSETPGENLAINMWQFSSEGLVSGCDMWVDLNVRVAKQEGTPAEGMEDTGNITEITDNILDIN